MAVVRTCVHRTLTLFLLVIVLILDTQSFLGLDDVVIRSLHALGKIHMKRNEDAQAEAALSRALAIARGSGINRPEAAEVLETYSQLLLEQARRIRTSLALTIHIDNAQ